MKVAFKFMTFFTLLTGIIYPMTMTALGQLLFKDKSNGSLLFSGKNAIGSELIAQKFSQEKYFWPRPSSTDWNTLASGASNLAPTSSKLRDLVNEQKLKFSDSSVGDEMLFMSASGLDPHVSLRSILGQFHRVTQSRSLTKEQIKNLQKVIEKTIEPPSFGFLGRERINVLKLNLELDQLGKTK